MTTIIMLQTINLLEKDPDIVKLINDKGVLIETTKVKYIKIEENE